MGQCNDPACEGHGKWTWMVSGDTSEAPDQLPEVDLVNLPPHYRKHPSGVECIQITEHMNFCLGNTIKYIWRSNEKGNPLEDLKKARWYLDREIQRIEKQQPKS